MKKAIILISVLLLAIHTNTFSFSNTAISINTYGDIVKPSSDNPANAALQVLVKMKTTDIEKVIGRKLKFKEKLALIVLKLKVKTNGFNDVKSKDGNSSQTLGIISIVTLFLFPIVTIPLGILAIIYGNKALKINPNDKAANTGKILGIISLALLLLIIILVVAIIASFTNRIWRG